MIDFKKLQLRVDTAYEEVERQFDNRKWGHDNDWLSKHKEWMRLVSVSTAVSKVEDAQSHLDYVVAITGFVEE